jgi:hypothetical protein
MTNIYRADFDAAISMLTIIRDRALDIEIDIRQDDPLGDFDDALKIFIDTDPLSDTPAFAAMMDFIRSLDD